MSHNIYACRATSHRELMGATSRGICTRGSPEFLEHWSHHRPGAAKVAANLTPR